MWHNENVPSRHLRDEHPMANQTIPELNATTKEQLLEVLRRHQIVRASVFGSVARGEATAESDLDLLVEFPPGRSLLDLVDLQHELTETLGKKVDVVTYRSVHHLIRDRVFSEQIQIL
jgi:predicted nucleotidyltransferase